MNLYIILVIDQQNKLICNLRPRKCHCCCLGYSLQLLSSNLTRNAVFPQIGEWHSKLLSPQGTKLCFRLNIDAPIDFWLYAELLTGDSESAQSSAATTVFNSSDVGQTQLNLETHLSLDFQLTATSLVQLVVYVSQDVMINSITFAATHCSVTSKSSCFIKLSLIFCNRYR